MLEKKFYIEIRETALKDAYPIMGDNIKMMPTLFCDHSIKKTPTLFCIIALKRCLPIS
ncbi:hypothetical protein BTM329_13850 [Helicobacter pylori]